MPKQKTFKLTLDEVKALYAELKHSWIGPETTTIVLKLQKFVKENELDKPSTGNS